MFCSIDIFLLCNLLKSIVCLFNVIKIKLVTFSKTGLKKIFLFFTFIIRDLIRRHERVLGRNFKKNKGWGQGPKTERFY